MTKAKPIVHGEGIPDRFCIHPASPFYVDEYMDRGLTIMFNGEEQTRAVEYCISEGWIKRYKTDGVISPATGKPILEQAYGRVEVNWVGARTIN